MRWSLVVVRRLKTRIGDRVDIGVEYVGQNPRGVTMAVDGGASRAPGAPAPGKARALHRPLSAREREAAGDAVQDAHHGGRASPSGTACLTLRSATAEYTVRLKEPIEEQDDFVWLPYEVLDRRAADRVEPDRRRRQAVATARRPRPPSSPDVGAPTDWLIPQLGKRAGTAA